MTSSTQEAMVGGRSDVLCLLDNEIPDAESAFR
jgi:hypothetical protein